MEYWTHTQPSKEYYMRAGHDTIQDQISSIPSSNLKIKIEPTGCIICCETKSYMLTPYCLESANQLLTRALRHTQMTSTCESILHGK